ncbi:hypothetical protein NAPIS_ORF00194 [Vairimorpha apis BRL 01]|uniref:Uncharacterized protein n=1 Tax=Vairimorpha apis BRL 01 TaxID=1037528 RepID=T0L416_9MICR|nr:hypothetical protein NAPIS_ORF00194 [Vairimorpha apis BRL 01]
MFNHEYFKNLLNETSELIQNKQNNKDIEDIDARIESNKIALKLITEDIEDSDLKNEINKRLENFLYTFDDLKIQSSKPVQIHEDIENDILKSSIVLKNKAKRFLDGLVFDKEILNKVNIKMTKNISDTTENIKKITKNDGEVKTINLMFLSLLLFLFVYFIIRFI